METTIAPLFVQQKNKDLKLRFLVTKLFVIIRLTLMGVPWWTWKKHPTARPVDHLVRYMVEDQVSFVPFRRGIVVNVAVTKVFYRNGSLFELYEEWQKKPGSVEKLVRHVDFDGIGETMNKIPHQETPEEGSRRGLREELRFDDPSKYELRPFVEMREKFLRQSEKFPRLSALYRRHISICYISDELYRAEGYLETEADGRQIKFSWKKVQ